MVRSESRLMAAAKAAPYGISARRDCAICEGARFLGNTELERIDQFVESILRPTVRSMWFLSFGIRGRRDEPECAHATQAALEL